MSSTPTPPPPKPDVEKEEEEQDPEIVLTDVVKDEEAAGAGNHNEEDVHTQADSEDSGSRVPVMSKPVAPERTWMVRLISIAVLLVIAIVAVGVMGALGVFDSNSNAKSADPVLSESENFQSGGDVEVPGPAPPAEDPQADGDEPGTGQFEDWFDNDFDVNEQEREPTLPPTWIEDFEPWPDQDGGEYFYRSWYFEDGSIGPWTALGDGTTVSLVSEGIIEGSRSLLVDGRSEVSHGAGYELIGLFSEETDREKDALYYSFSGCMTFLSGGQGQCYYVLTITYGDGTEARIEYDRQSVTPGGVTEFWGEYSISESEAEWASAIVSVECDDPEVPFILDAMSVSLTIAPE